MNRQISTILMMFSIVIILGIFSYVLQPKNKLASFSMLNIGQGDSFLIQAANGRQMLIDGGKDSSVLSELSKVMPDSDRTIDVVIATHPDADHIGGLPMVFSRYKVGLFLTTQATTDTDMFKDLNDAVKNEKIPAYFARHGMNISLDGQTTFKILFPDRNTSSWETNTASIVGRLEIGNRSVLMTGDSPISIEKHLSKIEKTNLDVDILQIGHHGSKTSTSDIFLKTTSPKLGLISAGANNRYGHPAPEVTDRLKRFGIPFISTIDNGTTTYKSDGEKWLK